MMCFEGVLANPVFLGVVAICSVAAFVMLWTLKFQRFHGKSYYAATFLAMIWTLLTVGLEAASESFSCQIQWATLAWLGNGLVPIAWCFFVFAYIENAPWLGKRYVNAALIVVPLAIFALAGTNQWHHLVYTQASNIPAGEFRIAYAHGPAFYGFIVTLYAFVLASLVCLVRAFLRAKRSAWPLLIMLTAITVTPLTGNIAYVGFGFTVFGLDPTAFMFTLGIIAFTWLLVTSKTMDMASVGQSILFNTMSEPVILIDRHHEIALMNTAAKRSELLQDPVWLLGVILPHIEQVNSAGEVAQLSNGKKKYEPRIQKIESPLDPEKTILGWSVTFIDITERLEITSALEQALLKADDANRAKDEFVSVITHELRTPLTSLKGGLSLALSGHLGELPVPIRSSLEIANRSCARLSRLIDNLLLAQKIDSVALSLEKKPVDLVRLLEESFEENRAFASERGVQLSIAQVDESAVTVGDAFAIRQILDNLISNAVKFSSENGIVKGAITVTDGRIRLSIKDTGGGIPDGMEGKVFGRFGQVQNSRQGSTQGSGLGLHISKQLAEQLSGRVFYESEIGIGTTFHVEFPLRKEQSVTETELFEMNSTNRPAPPKKVG